MGSHETHRSRLPAPDALWSARIAQGPHAGLNALQSTPRVTQNAPAFGAILARRPCCRRRARTLLASECIRNARGGTPCRRRYEPPVYRSLRSGQADLSFPGPDLRSTPNCISLAVRIAPQSLTCSQPDGAPIKALTRRRCARTAPAACANIRRMRSRISGRRPPRPSAAAASSACSCSICSGDLQAAMASRAR